MSNVITSKSHLCTLIYSIVHVFKNPYPKCINMSGHNSANETILFLNGANALFLLVQIDELI